MVPGGQVPSEHAAATVVAQTNLSREKTVGSTSQNRRIAVRVVLLLAVVGLTACSSARKAPQPSAVERVTSAPTQAEPQSHPHRGLSIARDMLGMPYRYGGATPKGFDCSGLVYYSYRKAGIEVPRTTHGQYRQSQRVKLSRLQPGDLIFFRISRNTLSHVGIYVGGKRFIHAPSGGKRVAYASLDNPYWETRVVGAGRFQ